MKKGLTLEEAFKELSEKNKFTESADKIIIPAPYNKYFEIDNEYEPDEESGEYLVGDTIENYDMKLLAYLKPKDNAPEYLQDVFPFLVEDSDSRFLVIEIAGGRAYTVELEDFLH